MFLQDIIKVNKELHWERGDSFQDGWGQSHGEKQSAEGEWLEKDLQPLLWVSRGPAEPQETGGDSRLALCTEEWQETKM